MVTALCIILSHPTTVTTETVIDTGLGKGSGMLNLIINIYTSYNLLDDHPTTLSIQLLQYSNSYMHGYWYGRIQRQWYTN